MRVKSAASGQVIPIAALMMVAILGMAALAIDGSNLYSQHRRYQADLDVAVKTATTQLTSTSTYTGSLTQAMTSTLQSLAQDGFSFNVANTTISYRSGNNYDHGGCLTNTTGSLTARVCNPPSSGPFQGNSNYLEGNVSGDVTGFFGGVIGLSRMHINVRAVARRWGYNQPFAIIALLKNPNAPKHGNCGIDVQGGTNTGFTIDGNTMSNGASCITGSASTSVSGSSEMVQNPTQGQVLPGGGGQAAIGVNPVVDPNAPIPDPTSPIACTASTCVAAAALTDLPANCQSMVSSYMNPTGALTFTLPAGTYYFDPASAAMQVDWSKNSPANDYFFPGCDGSITGTVPGIYYFTGSIPPAAKVNIQSYSSTIILDPTFTIAIQGTTPAATMELTAPSLQIGTPYGGIALSQHPSDPVSCSTFPAITLTGNANTSTPTYGVIDTPCADITVSGNSGLAVKGTITADTVQVAGSGQMLVQYDSQLMPVNQGSVLVE